MSVPNIIIATDRTADIDAEKSDFDRRTTKPEMLDPKDAALMAPKIFDIVRNCGNGHWELTCDRCGTIHSFSWFDKAAVMHAWKTCCQDNALLFCRELGRWRNRFVNPTP